MTKSAVLNLLSVRAHVPPIHLDDVHIGQLIAEAKISDQMLQGISFCTGLGALHQSENSTKTVGWSLNDLVSNPCSIAGLTIFHGFRKAKFMKRVFENLKLTDIKNTCEYAHIIVAITSRWDYNSRQVVADEWRILFSNYIGYT